MFDFDARLFRSLGYLVLRPGFLSKEFSNGRRARYLSPGRLYLGMSLLCFFVLSVVGGGEIKFSELEVPAATKMEIAARLADPEQHKFARLLKTNAMELLQNPRASYQALLDNIHIALFVMLPLFALLMKGVYPRTFYAQHLVFSLHLYGFIFFVYSLIVLIPDSAPGGGEGGISLRLWDSLGALLTLSCFVYFYLALKTAYAEGTLRTLLKFSLLGISYVMLLVLGLLTALLLTLMLF